MSTTRDRLHPHRRKTPSLISALQSRLECGVQSRELCGTKQSLTTIRQKLEMEEQNVAANRLEEGIEQTLTLHMLSMENELRQWLLTTNIMKNINRSMKQRFRRIRHRVNSDQCHRLVTMALVEAERGCTKLNNPINWRHYRKSSWNKP